MTKKTVETLTIEECEKLLNHLSKYSPLNDGNRRSLRDVCMCLVMLDAGLRVGELISLPLGALLFLNKPVDFIQITSNVAKKGAARHIPTSLRLFEAVTRMYQGVWEHDHRNPEQTAFYNLGTQHPLTKQAVGRIIKGAGWNALRRSIHPHMLRHTFATQLMRTTNSRVVQALLGHKHMSSTQIYCHPDSQDLRKAIDSLPAGPERPEKRK